MNQARRSAACLARPLVVYRRQPWPEVDALVAQGRPDGVALRVLDADVSAEQLRSALVESDALLGSWVRGWPLRADDFAACPRLRLVQLMSSGFDGLDLHGAADAGVPVANIGSANSTTVAEHALMLILALLRNLPAQDAAVRAGSWRPALPALEARRRTLGIIGMGNTGRALAGMAAALDMPLIYNARTRLGRAAEGQLGLQFIPLRELLRSSDVVSLNLALAPGTRHLIGSEELSLMKSTAYLVNTSRGGLIDEQALASALQRGALAGAALDVLADEPPAPTAPLLQLPNVILTPHQAGLSPDAWPRIVEECWANIRRATAGEPIRNRVG